VPELPEVHALVADLGARLVGRTVDRVDVVSFAALKTFEPPVTRLAGGTITAVSRHGKFLDIAIDTVPIDPAAIAPATTNPVGTNPDTTIPATTDPVTTNPDTTDPVTTNPVTTDPVGTPSGDAPAGTTLHLVLHLAKAGWIRWREGQPPPPSRSGKGPLAARLVLRVNPPRSSQDVNARKGSQEANQNTASHDAALQHNASQQPDQQRAALNSLAQETVAQGPVAPDAVAPDALAPDAVAPDSGAPDSGAPDSVAGSGLDITEAGTKKSLAIYLVTDPFAVPGIARLGPDPLDPGFTEEVFSAILASAGRAQIKGVLRNQSLIAGIGNAYSDEILHAAKMSPFKPAAMTRHEIERLFDVMLSTLTGAVARADGLAASELKREKKSGLRVHGRTGEACPVCGDTVREVIFADSTLQYCPTCQTNGKPLADRVLSRLLK
jgi:formamidopyrimidine-DNA glycosylase